MGNADADGSTKTPKSSSAQEQPPASSPATVYPDWASLQAYYNSAGTPPMPPPGFFPSPVASNPQGHPYMWGQHLIPPYGTPPPPYVAMYTHGGLYAHPSIPQGSHPYSPYAVPSLNGTAEASVPAGSKDGEGKSGDCKSRSPLKRSKGSLGSLGMLTGKGNEMGKASGASASGGISQSGDSGSEGSSEGSDANSQNGSQHNLSVEQGSADAEAQNGSTACSVSNMVTQTPPAQGLLNQSMVIAVPPNGVSGPTTNLNIGMDYWGGSAPTSIVSGRSKLPVVPAPTAVVPSGQIGTRDGVSTELWIQDERELKRQKRKQSNRESARRSRLRKQAECEELAQRVETLREENTSLREELERLRDECEKLTSENASLTEKLQGQESGVDGVNGPPDSDPQTVANTDSMEKDS